SLITTIYVLTHSNPIVLNSFPTRRSSDLNLGNISFQEKNYAQSIEEYKNALRRNPKDDETRYNLRLAQLLLKKQQQEQQNQDKKDRKSTRLNSSHVSISYAVFCLKKKKTK